MKPEYRSLDLAGTVFEVPECLASLVTSQTPASPRTWSIGELARECGVTLRALRFYEGKGLLAPARHGGARLYGGEDLRRLKLVLRLKRVGFSLIEIRDLMQGFTEPGRPAGRLEELLARIENQVAVLEEQRREIDLSLVAVAEEIDGLKRMLAR
ncbi:MAG: MerR family transcriptional regulator [Siculibacillus sp.]|nr:MerR family transcriptional regulator [Siculibacillus sp.]